MTAGTNCTVKIIKFSDFRKIVKIRHNIDTTTLRMQMWTEDVKRKQPTCLVEIALAPSADWRVKLHTG